METAISAPAHLDVVITSSLFIGGILMTVYYLAATIKNIKEMIQWK